MYHVAVHATLISRCVLERSVRYLPPSSPICPYFGINRIHEFSCYRSQSTPAKRFFLSLPEYLERILPPFLMVPFHALVVPQSL